MNRPRRFSALTAAAGLLLIAGCGSVDHDDADEDQVATAADSHDSVNSWREAARATVSEGSEGCIDMLPEEAVALIDGITGLEMDWVQAIAFDTGDDLMCHYRSGMGTTEKRQVRVDLEFDNVLCDPPPTNGPEVHTGSPKDGSETVGDEEVDLRLSSVTACGETGAALGVTITALRDSEAYDLLTSDDHAADIAQALGEHDAQIVEDANELREEALAAEE